MKQVAFHKQILGEDLLLSNDVNELKKHMSLGGPAILLLDDDNKYEDTAFARYAVDVSDYTDPLEYLIEDYIGDEYLEKVVSRYLGIPLTIGQSDDGNVLVRELAGRDAQQVIRIYDEADSSLEPFYENEAEAAAILEDYSDSHYDFAGYGLWGICKAGSDDIIGLVGFTDRDDGRELGYALLESFRGQNIAYRACIIALNYIETFDNENVSGDDMDALESEICVQNQEIYVRVKKDNLPAVKLAKRLSGEYGISIREYDL